MLDSFQDLIDTNLFAYAKHKIVLENHEPVDYVFLEVNKAFENMTGLKASQIINKRVSLVIPEILDDEFNWIKFYGKLAIEGGKEEFEQYSYPLKKWYKVMAFSSNKNYFSTIFSDITHEQLIANISAEINNYNTENIDYTKILETIKTISGAEYAIFNKFDKAGKDFTTIAVTGFSPNINKAINFIGFGIVGRKWKYDAKREAKLKDNKTTVFNSLKDLSGKNFPKQISEKITSNFNIGNTVIIKTQKGDRTIGDFTLIFDKNSKLRNQYLSESFADMIGSAIARIESEEELKISAQRFKGIYSESVAAIYLFDNQKNFIDTNQAGIDLLGYSRKELLELQIKDVDADPKEVKPAHKELLKGNRLINFEHKLIRKDGQIITVINNSRALTNENGEVTGLLSTLIDISDRKNLEGQYKLLAEQYKLINDNLEIGIVLIDKNMNIISINPKMQEWFGAESIKENQKCYNTFPDKQKEKNQICKDCPVLSTIKSRKIQKKEKIYNFKSESRIFNITTSPVIINNKDVEFVIEMFEDVTERKQLEKIIKKKSELNQIISGISSDLVVADCSNIDGKINNLLQVVGEFYRVDRAFVVRFTDDNRYFSITHEWCKNRFIEEIDNTQNITFEEYPSWKNEILNNEILSISDVNNIPKRFYKEKKELERRKIKSLLTVPLLIKNKAVGVIGFNTVIEIREWSNKDISNLRLIANILSDTIAKIDSNQEILMKSELQTIIMNIAKVYINMPVHEYAKNINKSLKEIGSFVKADRAYIFDYDFINNTCTNTYEWCANGISPEIENLRNIPLNAIPQWVSRHKKGLQFFVADVTKLPNDGHGGLRDILEPQGIKSLITFPMLDNDRLIGFVGFDSVRSHHLYSESDIQLLNVYAQSLVNLYNRIKNIEQIEEAKLKAEKANKTKSEFLAKMSHEIRTPLNGVIGFSELLKNTELNQRQIQYINIINTSASLLMGIIDDILDFSKIEAGKLNLKLVKTNIIDIANQTANIVYLDAQKKGIELFINIQENVPDYITVDSIRLKQVLVNLMSNAVKFTDKGEIELKISFINSNKDRGIIKFSVIDTGIGITKQQQKQLFKAFSQADSSTVRKSGGTGLGLAISQIIVNKMNGEIKIKSEENKGSEFYFEIETDYESKEISKDDINYKKVYVIIENKRINNVITGKLEKIDSVDIVSLNYLPKKDITEKFDDTYLIIADFHLLNDRIQEISRSESINKDKQTSPKIIILFIPYELTKLEILTKDNPNIIKLAKPVNTSYLIDRIYFPNKMFDFQLVINQNSQLLPELLNISKKNHVILLGEDNEVNMMLLEMILEELLPSAILLKAINGVEVLEMYDNYYPDLILLDIQMPIINGLEVTEIIRRKESGTDNHVPIIATTAGAILEEKQKCFDAGMDDFITKPIDRQKLIKCLIEFLQ